MVVMESALRAVIGLPSYLRSGNGTKQELHSKRASLITTAMPGFYHDDVTTDYPSYEENRLTVLSPQQTNDGGEEDALLSYNALIESLRHIEYPQIRPDTVYLDHAGTAVPSRSLVNRFSDICLTTLYGNPHSGSTGAASLAASKMVDDVRVKVLQWFNASADDFDVVFVANATAGIKMIAAGVRGWSKSPYRDGSQRPRVDTGQTASSAMEHTWLGYHADSHTSLVGLREEFDQAKCFADDEEIDNWLQFNKGAEGCRESLRLLAYPAQSNMSGRKLPLRWIPAARLSGIFTLLDAAALAATSPLDLSDTSQSPDFTVMSFYKMFGMPDMGALIVKKSAGHILAAKSYFGGGTVQMVSAVGEQWSIRKQTSLHEVLEDGTLPIHNIAMLDCAFQVHTELFGTMRHVQMHTSWLTGRLLDGLTNLKHWNGSLVCNVYGDHEIEDYGPIIAFNIWNSKGQWVSNFEVEKLASIRHIQLRTGGVCNPGGIANALNLSPWEMQSNFSAGQKCGGDNDIINGKPTGVIRVSIGAMSILSDVNRFLDFMKEFFVDNTPPPARDLNDLRPPGSPRNIVTGFAVESLTIYPIKSCAGWSIPRSIAWSLRREGLAWDREWCLVHKGSRNGLSQKRYTKMALLKPRIDFDRGLLIVEYNGSLSPNLNIPSSIALPLSVNPSAFKIMRTKLCSSTSTICGENIAMNIYASAAINNFFSTVLETPCELARFPALSSEGESVRHAKSHLSRMSSTSSSSESSIGCNIPILLSNESPLLVIFRSSLDRLNEIAKPNEAPGHTAPASAFRANIVVSSNDSLTSSSSSDHDNLEASGQQAYIEDFFGTLRISPTASKVSGRAQDCCPHYSISSSDADSTSTSTSINSYPEYRCSFQIDMLGPCRRCQMICINQETGEKAASGEPFATLAKTRRKDGKVYFGMHAALGADVWEGRIQVGDRVEAVMREGLTKPRSESNATGT